MRNLTRFSSTVCILFVLPGLAVAQTNECTDTSATASAASADLDIFIGTASSTGECETSNGCHDDNNEPPDTNPDSYTLDQDTTLNEAAPGVLANDSDPDGDTITAELFTGTSNGSISLNADGSFDYTPTAGFSGADSFVYFARDTEGLISFTTDVTLTVNFVDPNTPPVASADSYTLDQDTTLDVTAPGVLGNDTDGDGDGLTAALVSGPVNGGLTLNPDGSFSYTPNVGYSGPDSFSYLANDGTDDSGPATVSLTINFVNTNTPPVANVDSYTLDQDTTLDVTAPGVLGNDTDADFDDLTAALVSGPANGNLTLNPDGSFSYTPTPGFSGSDSFSYLAQDGSDDSGAATVSLTVNFVNTPPIATVDSYLLNQNTTLDVTAPGVLGNDNDANGDGLTAALVSGPANGLLTLNPDGSFSYTPTPGFSGSDSFSYLANDGTDDSTPATVSLTVNFVNTPPVATTDSYT
ncbi:MAG: Ig-like domain-containing protein, partial [Gammaproteobacteria bacterium]